MYQNGCGYLKKGVTPGLNLPSIALNTWVTCPDTVIVICILSLWLNKIQLDYLVIIY